ncbi:hypothetical protein [Paraburkholderia adhaesiva]|uniref:hypothetical protein n=1 Tax=Paraburkholderia adhaesiva TaxID=2883244 RepID=UPI001F23891D|nr:hypothetical protein [Paraburkholderia adhaesiva]
MLKPLVFASALLGAAVAWAGTLHAGDAVALHGRLALRGNEPFVYAVVYDDRGGVWTLKGVSRADAARLQNHIVQVTGTVSSEDAGEPAAQVRSIRLDDPQ